MKLRNKKTGEVFDALIREKGGNGAYSHIVCDIKAYEPNAGVKAEKRYVLGEYNSLTELNEDWEDYEQAEPLIKDEKARKVFREWAEFFGAELFRVTHLFRSGKRGTTIIRSTDLTTEPVIELPGYIGEDSEIHTKIELCGEEAE